MLSFMSLGGLCQRSSVSNYMHSRRLTRRVSLEAIIEGVLIIHVAIDIIEVFGIDYLRRVYNMRKKRSPVEH